MGIKFNCPQGHKLNVKSFLAGRRGICPHCDARFRIPMESGGTAELIVKGDRSKGEATRLTAEMQDQPQSTEAAPTTQTTASPAGMAQASAGTFTENVGVNPQSMGGATAYASPNAADPISEAPNAVWYVRPRSGGQYGPAAGDILREWINEGRVAGDSLVWCEGWPDWRQASSVFPQLAGAVSFPSPVSAGAMPIGGGAVPAGPVTAVGAAAPNAGAIPIGAAVPVGGTAQPGGTFGTGDAFGGTSSGGASSNVSRGAVRRKSGSFTTLIVVILVLVAIVLAGVFAMILFGQSEVSTAWKTSALTAPAVTAQSHILS